jgi:D-3-phosphoglycerate dehydrogenase
MPRIIVLDNLSQDGLDLLEAAGNIEYEVRTGLKGDALRAALSQFDGAICRSGVKITADALEGNRRLKAIARAGVGTDNIDKEVATRLGIVVMNTPGGNTLSTAEHTIALMLAMSRNVYPAYRSLIERRWDRKPYMGTQLAGKTLGIVGLGRIGQAVAKRALAFEMRVIGYDPFLSDQRAQELGIKMYDSAREMLPDVDYLTVHTPLNDATRNLIGPDAIRAMRRGVRLINCARGGIFDEDALVEGLKTGHLAGVALDVYASEPCTDSPLFGLPGVLCTPHLGASTAEAQTSVAVEAAELLIDFFTTGTIRQSVNMSPLDPKTLESLRGSLDTAHRLGLLLGQVIEGPPQVCRLRYSGEVAGKDTRLVSAAFAAGFLYHAMDTEVNVVNAELLLRERGIELVEERSTDLGEFSSLITATVESKEGTSIAAGTLFGKNMPRLVQKGVCRLEIPLQGILMFITLRDMPGVIGKIGNVFGKHQINIAQMSVGRGTDQPGGQQVAALSLDGRPPAEALAEVLTIEAIRRVRTAQLPPADEVPAWMGG